MVKKKIQNMLQMYEAEKGYEDMKFKRLLQGFDTIEKILVT